MICIYWDSNGKPIPLSCQTPTCFNLEWIVEWSSTHFSIQADVGFEPLFFPGSYIWVYHFRYGSCNTTYGERPTMKRWFDSQTWCNPSCRGKVPL